MVKRETQAQGPASVSKSSGHAVMTAATSEWLWVLEISANSPGFELKSRMGLLR